MRVEVLPSAGPGAADALSAYLFDGEVAIDAGPLGVHGSPEQQARVRHVFLTHSHVDHLATLPLFIDNVYGLAAGPVVVHGLPATLDCLRNDVFNGRLWPDFVELSKSLPPFLQLAPLEPGECVRVAGLRLTAVLVDHVIPTVAYVVEGRGAAAAVVTDTRATAAVWEALRSVPDLAAVFLECSFPAAQERLAQVSGHLTTRTFAAELDKVPAGVPVHAVHIKPRWREQVVAELATLGRPRVCVAESGRPYQLGGGG